MNRRRRVSKEDIKKTQRIPISRLSDYVKVLGRLGTTSDLPFERFLISLDDVTKRQLMQDLDLLGIPQEKMLPAALMARAVRKEIRRARLASKAIHIKPVELPSRSSFLKDLRDSRGISHAERADAIEKAYAYAVERPDFFLLAHGAFTKEITAYRHQVEEARRIVEHFLGNAIVVHEVGLGKTITGILIWCEFLVRDPYLTSLILVPANLRKQWRDEIATCVDIKIITGPLYKEEEVASSQHVLMAIDTAKEQRWAEILTKRNWGLLIIDEGHLLRHDNTVRYRFVYSLHSYYRILLTATPVHNSGYDIFHQVNIVRPGHLGRKAVFADWHMRGERQIRDAEILQERLKIVVSRKQRDLTGLAFPERDINEVFVEDPSDLERQLYGDVLTLLRGIYRRHLGSVAFVRRPSGEEQGVAQIVLIAILVLRELASHPLAAIKTLLGPLLKSAARLAKVTGDSSDFERLERTIKPYASVRWQNGNHSKTDTLINELPELVEKYGRVIVYVAFRETQKVIVKRLQKKRSVGLPRKTAVISYHGSLSLGEKDYQIERFNDNGKACFISTDAGGQGLNLQSGNIVVNFDFPWNPMRVEQRIGRVDRLEQKKRKVVVRNFITRGTIEQYVYQTLREKLKVCEDVLGHILPQIFRLHRINVRYCNEEDVFGIGQLILSSEDDNDLRQKFLALEQDLDEHISGRQTFWRPRRRWIDE